jgi:hypothetical protein
MAVKLDEPALSRVGYENERAFVEFDFGLTPKARKNPSRAPFTFVIYAIDPRWGMRDAVSRYYALFPRFFEERIHDEGIVLTARPSDVVKQSDFHILAHWQFPLYDRQTFKYNSSKGILNLYYSLFGGTAFVPVEGVRGASYRYEYFEEFVENLRKRVESISKPVKNQQLVKFVAIYRSLIRNKKGKFVVRKIDPAYMKGGLQAVCNPDPDLFTDRNFQCPNKAHHILFVAREFPERLPALMTVLERQKNAIHGIDGVGLDVLDSHTLRAYNFNRTHFPYADHPLTFMKGAPCIYQAFSLTEFLSFISGEMKERGKYVGGNIPNGIHHPWIAPFIDLPFSEIGVIPQKDVMCNFKRTMYRHKPYSLLLLAHLKGFAGLSGEELRSYFHQVLFYGFYPSFHDSQNQEKQTVTYYWDKRRLYDRDRHRFKKYLPLIIENNVAGWQPVTHGWIDDDNVFVERFGPGKGKPVRFTVWNNSPKKSSFSLTVDRAALDLQGAEFVELVSGKKYTGSIAGNHATLRAEIEPHRTMVFKYNGK